MRHPGHPWQTVGLLVGSLFLGPFSITPTMAAPVMYTFTGVVAESDSAPTSSQPFNTSAPLSRMSASKNRFTTQLVGSNRHTANLGSLGQVNVGSYQGYFPFNTRDQRQDISIPNFSKTAHLHSAKDGLTLIPISSVTPLLSQNFTRTLDEPISAFRTATLPDPSELPPSIGAFSYSNQLRLPFNSETAPLNPVTIAQGTLAPSTTVPLPASLIIAGIGLVALIGLGAGGLRHN